MNSGAETSGWLATWRRYLAFIAVTSLVWETLHLPLYTIWREGRARELAFAVIHCTAGDLLTALSSLTLALVLAGTDAWPMEGFGRVAALTVAFGASYTIFSEWLNIVVRRAWAYSETMPVVPFVDAGLSPVAQWLVLPLAGLWWVRRAAVRSSDRSGHGRIVSEKGG